MILDYLSLWTIKVHFINIIYQIYILLYTLYVKTMGKSFIVNAGKL